MCEWLLRLKEGVTETGMVGLPPDLAESVGSFLPTQVVHLFAKNVDANPSAMPWRLSSQMATYLHVVIRC